MLAAHGAIVTLTDIDGRDRRGGGGARSDEEHGAGTGVLAATSRRPRRGRSGEEVLATADAQRWAACRSSSTMPASARRARVEDGRAGGLASHDGHQRRQRVPRLQARAALSARQPAGGDRQHLVHRRRSSPTGNMPPTTPRRPAVMMLTKSVALDCARARCLDVRCNSVHPGLHPHRDHRALGLREIRRGGSHPQADEASIPMKRLGHPDDVAHCRAVSRERRKPPS